jgi:hypothetical protein
MAIQVSDYVSKPALAYNRVHVTDLHITLEETQVAKTRVAINYKLYGEDADGIKYFDKTLRSIVYDDFDQEIMARAQAGDMTLAAAMQAIQGAVAAVLAYQGTYGATEVV